MHKVSKLPWIIIFYCFVSILIMTASLIKKDEEYSSFENRTMAYLPHPYLKEIASGEWFSKFETYCLDQVIGRDLFVETNRNIFLYISGT